MNTDNLKKYKYNTYSQNGEDGILEEVFKRLGLDEFNKFWVVEFGAWDGKHLSNTYNLIKKGASSCLIEGDSAKFLDLLDTKKDYPNIYPIEAFVGGVGENSLDSLLGQTPIKKNYEVLSIDVDSYENLEIWKNYTGNPILVIIEANTAYLPFERNIPKEFGNIFYDTNQVAIEKGYKLIAHTPNHFYIKKEFYHKIYGEQIIPDEKFFNFNSFIKWRQLTRTEIIKLLITNFKFVYFIPALVKLLPLRLMHIFVNKFYKL